MLWTKAPFGAACRMVGLDRGAVDGEIANLYPGVAFHSFEDSDVHEAGAAQSRPSPFIKLIKFAHKRLPSRNLDSKPEPHVRPK